MDDRSTTPRTTFLDLPGELRNEIYRYALSPVLEHDEDPWIFHPPWSRFRSLLDLALCSRQIGAEATSLFYKEFAPLVRLHSTDFWNLHDFYEYAMRRERLRKMRFSFRAGIGWPLLLQANAWVDTEDGPRQCFLKSFFLAHYVASTSLFYGRRTMMLGRDCDGNLESPPGFRVEERTYRKGQPFDDECCHVSLHHPRSTRSVRFITHYCERHQRTIWGHRGFHTPCEELEGELQDLDFSQFDIPKMRADRYHNELAEYDYRTDAESECDSWQATEDEESDDSLDDAEMAEVES